MMDLPCTAPSEQSKVQGRGLKKTVLAAEISVPSAITCNATA